MPDPQDPATFHRSKLFRQRDEELAGLYGRLLAARRELGPADAVAERVDDVGLTLTVRRGDATLAMNFSREQRAVPVSGEQVAVSTHDVRLEDGHAILPPLAGALVR